MDDRNKVEKTMNAFTAKRAYKGAEFARDYSGKGTVKKVTAFSVAEHFYSSFVLDYLTNRSSGTVKFLPSIISDKSKIIKINIDLNTLVSGKELKNLSVEEIRQKTK
jgi:hypothetical protein